MYSMNHVYKSLQNLHGKSYHLRNDPHTWLRDADNSFRDWLNKGHKWIGDRCNLVALHLHGRLLGHQDEHRVPHVRLYQRFRGRDSTGRVLGPGFEIWISCSHFGQEEKEEKEGWLGGKGEGERTEKIIHYPATPHTMQVRRADAAVSDLDVHICLCPRFWREWFMLQWRGRRRGHPAVEGVWFRLRHDGKHAFEGWRSVRGLLVNLS